MKLVKLHASHYRILRDVTVEMNGLNLFIGANAAGKSTVLDALRFLHEGVRDREFIAAARARGGILNLPWKGEAADQTELTGEVDGGGARYEWSLRLVRDGHEFQVEEGVNQLESQRPPTQLLDARRGEGWWWSGERGRVELSQGPNACALAAAAADASFPAREVAEFVRRWGFVDPDIGRFDPYGRNLAETLYGLQRSAPDTFAQIVDATQDLLGLPSRIEPRESDDSFYFVQHEPGLRFPVHQMGVSSGTLRMLALMTALFAESEANLIGIEEPENYVHPTAIASFVEYLRAHWIESSSSLRRIRLSCSTTWRIRPQCVSSNAPRMALLRLRSGRTATASGKPCASRVSAWVLTSRPKGSVRTEVGREAGIRVRSLLERDGEFR